MDSGGQATGQGASLRDKGDVEHLSILKFSMTSCPEPSKTSQALPRPPHRWTQGCSHSHIVLPGLAVSSPAVWWPKDVSPAPPCPGGRTHTAQLPLPSLLFLSVCTVFWGPVLIPLKAPISIIISSENCFIIYSTPESSL